MQRPVQPTGESDAPAPGSRVDTISGAILCPLTRLVDPVVDPQTGRVRNGHFDGGVYRPDGHLILKGENKYLSHDNTPAPRIDPAPAVHLHGKYLYAGLVQNLHFGHFLTENTTRLWALDHVGEIDGIVYLGRYPNQPLADYIQALFEIFAPGVPLIPIRAQTRVDTLLLPEALRFPLGALYGHSLNRQYFASRIAALAPSSTPLPDKVFVSRSRLARAGARFVLEEAIDANFRAQGYAVIYPEQLSVADQLRIYAHASTLVFSEGSAIHLYVLAARPGQKVFFIWRRKVMHPIFARQLESFGAGPLEGGNHVLALLPSLRFPTAPARASSLVDFAALAADLQACGFIDAQSWTVPGPGRLEAAVRDLGDLFDISDALKALTSS